MLTGLIPPFPFFFLYPLALFFPPFPLLLPTSFPLLLPSFFPDSLLSPLSLPSPPPFPIPHLLEDFYMPRHYIEFWARTKPKPHQVIVTQTIKGKRNQQLLFILKGGGGRVCVQMCIRACLCDGRLSAEGPETHAELLERLAVT